MASFIRTTLRCLGPEHLCTQLMLCLSVPLRRGSLILTGSTIFYSLVNKPSCCWLRYCYVSALLTLTCALLIVCLYRPPEPVSLPKQSSICADAVELIHTNPYSPCRHDWCIREWLLLNHHRITGPFLTHVLWLIYVLEKVFSDVLLSRDSRDTWCYVLTWFFTLLFHWERCIVRMYFHSYSSLVLSFLIW